MIKLFLVENERFLDYNRKMAQEKRVVISGVRPTGEIHLGNYLGAIKQFVELQKKHRAFFFIADLHAITEPQDPKTFIKQTLDIASLYLACGLDPRKTTLFVQSHLPEHLELAHILGTLTPVGELNRMTQYKEKVQEGKPANFGLFAYPVLMAADILLYQTDFVPVGEDQLQHLEFTRTIARKFNSRFGKTLKEPEAILQKEGARIMSLKDPRKKMSKSSGNGIGLLDFPLQIQQKIKSAVTDSGKEIKYAPETKAAISNLLVIYSLFSEKSISELEKKYRGKSYSEFKSDLTEVLVEKLSPIREKYREFFKNPEKVKKILATGAMEARKVARKTLQEVKKKIGLLT